MISIYTNTTEDLKALCIELPKQSFTVSPQRGANKEGPREDSEGKNGEAEETRVGSCQPPGKARLRPFFAMPNTQFGDLLSLSTVDCGVEQRLEKNL